MTLKYFLGIAAVIFVATVLTQIGLARIMGLHHQLIELLEKLNESLDEIRLKQH